MNINEVKTAVLKKKKIYLANNEVTVCDYIDILNIAFVQKKDEPQPFAVNVQFLNLSPTSLNYKPIYL